MFKKESLQPVINVSLSWETFEQYALWQLLLGQLSVQNSTYYCSCTSLSKGAEK